MDENKNALPLTLERVSEARGVQMILQTIQLDGFKDALIDVCLIGETITVWTEPQVQHYGKWIPGEGADICLYQAQDDNRVVGCRLALRREK